VNAIRLHVLLPGLSLWQAWRFTMIAVLFGTALPGQLAGDAVKAFRLARAASDVGEVTHALAAVAVDKIISMFALLILTALGVGLNPGTFGRPLELAAGLVTILMPLALLIGFTAPLPPWLGRVGAAFASWREVALSPRILLLALVLGFGFQSLSIASVALLGHALGITLTISVWCVVVGLVSVVLLLPVTIAGLGLREGSLIAVLGLLGQKQGAALALSLGLFALTLLGAGVGLVVDLMGRDRHA
jgi:hypothetical protein